MAIIEAMNISTDGKGVMIVRVQSGKRSILEDNIPTKDALVTALKYAETAGPIYLKSAEI